MLNLGYPLWLLIAVLMVLGVLTFYVLHGRVADRILVPLTLVLTPLCTVAVLAVAVLISALLLPLFEAPTDSVRQNPQKTPAATPEPTSAEPVTTAPQGAATPAPEAGGGVAVAPSP